jgi:thiol:disulfide interchange protein DsbD
VLPVIPLKIMGLAATAGNRRRCAHLGAALSVGVVLFWIGLGVAVAALAGFTSSQLFQYPLFTVGVGLVIGVMAVGMCGVFSVQLPQSIAGIDFRHDTILGSVGFGVMTAVLSTPCTAPLMGAAAAWAATQPPVTVLSVFGAIGAGMATPYLVLSIFPQLVSRVPRSGPASDLVKQTMGLLLLAAAAYFVGSGVSGWLVSPPTPPSHAYWWVVSALGTAAGFWLARGTLRIAKSARARTAFTALGCAIALLSGAIAWRLTDEGPIAWVYYTPERLDAALREGDAVIIDFTAEWCLNCKTLENTVLATEAVVARIDRGDVTPIKVDLTGNNEAGRALLTRFERLTIPLLVVMTRDGRVVFKSDAYTPAQVINALDEATGTGTPAVTTAP